MNMREMPDDPFFTRLRAVAAAAAEFGRALLRRRAGGGTLVYNNGRNEGPPDLDELWRDFTRKLTGLFGGNRLKGLEFR